MIEYEAKSTYKHLSVSLIDNINTATFFLWRHTQTLG